MLILLLLGSLLLAGTVEAQMLCTPTGGSLYCSGVGKSFAITPLPGGSSMIMDQTPRRTDPIPVERSRFADSLLNRPYVPIEPDRSHFNSLMERSAPVSEWRMKDDDLPPPPFPE